MSDFEVCIFVFVDNDMVVGVRMGIAVTFSMVDLRMDLGGVGDGPAGVWVVGVVAVHAVDDIDPDEPKNMFSLYAVE